MSAYQSLAPLYDDLTGDIDYFKFADFYENIFEQRNKKVNTLLDVACGTGTITEIMAYRGYEMIATDMSPEMLCIARDKISAKEGIVQPLFLCQPMEELDLYGTVDAAVSCLDAVNYLPYDFIPEFLKRLHLFIIPNGIFIFDINSPEKLHSLDGFTSVDEDENKLCLWRADYDEDEDALIYGMDIFTRQGKLWDRSCEEHIEYAHTPEGLKKLLEDAGFINIEICKDGPQKDMGRIFIIAENTSH